MNSLERYKSQADAVRLVSHISMACKCGDTVDPGGGLQRGKGEHSEFLTRRRNGVENVTFKFQLLFDTVAAADAPTSVLMLIYLCRRNAHVHTWRVCTEAYLNWDSPGGASTCTAFWAPVSDVQWRCKLLTCGFTKNRTDCCRCPELFTIFLFSKCNWCNLKFARCSHLVANFWDESSVGLSSKCAAFKYCSLWGCR